MISRESIEVHFPGIEEALYEKLLQQGEMAYLKAEEKGLHRGYRPL